MRELAAQVGNANLGQHGVSRALGHLDACPSDTVERAAAAAVEGLGRRRSRAQHERAAIATRHLGRHLARMVARAGTLLIAGLVLLVDDDEAQVCLLYTSVAAYGCILPDEVLHMAPLGIVNVHASLLPRWRGAAPIQRAILAGDEVAGVSIMRIGHGVDTGAYCAQASTSVAGKPVSYTHLLMISTPASKRWALCAA